MLHPKNKNDLLLYSYYFKLLPDVYLPHYYLNYFQIREEGSSINIEYNVIEKEAPRKLLLLQRFVTFGKRKNNENVIANETKLKLRDI